MDHHYSWRGRPPPIVQGNNNNICPICSISHFPFCPPHPPPYNQNPRFLNNNYFPDRPQFDHPPYHNHHIHDNFHDGFRDRLPRHISPNLPSYDNGIVGVKRMRSDDYGLSTSENQANYSNFVSEDERRLKLLIRDHGGGGGDGGFPPLKLGRNGYMHEQSGLGWNYSNNVDDVERPRIDESSLKVNNKAEMYEFQNPCIDSFDTGQSHTDPGIGYRTCRETESFGYGQRFMHGVEDADKARFHHNSCMTNSPMPVPEMSNGIKRQSAITQSGSYSCSGSPNDVGLYHNSQRINPSDPMSIKEPNHLANWHGMQGSTNEQRNDFTIVNREFGDQMSYSYRFPQNSEHQNHDTRQPFEVKAESEYNISSSSDRPNMHNGVYPHIFNGVIAGAAPRVYDRNPPLPASPPPPLPMEPLYPRPFASSSPPIASGSLFPISVSSSLDVPPSHPSIAEAHSLTQKYHSDKQYQHTLAGVPSKDIQAHQASLEKHSGEHHTFPLRSIVSEKSKAIDASQIFKKPHRANRPDHIVIILRGLPGSGKSYLAKILRDLEVENGGDAPRIHSIDDYFMTEVEKVLDSEFSKSSGSSRGRKQVVKKVMEYCYEPEMEEAYRASMLKAFKKTLDEGVFSFIIVDDRNLRVADFAQFWATAKRSGFEVYLLEATYKDPAGCAARNVHGFTKDDIQKMAVLWEEAPSLYLKLDAKSLLGGSGLEDGGIQEVEMDMEDEDPIGGLNGSDEKPQDHSVTLENDLKASGPAEHGKTWSTEDKLTEEVKELRTSKWSEEFDEGDVQRSESSKSNSNSLSGLISAYSKKGKSVTWGDKVGSMGFSIGAAKKAKLLSLVIGPGAGYNLKSNPLTEKDNLPSTKKNGESQRQNVFQEQLRAEQESFKVIFEKRRQRIGGLGTEDDGL